MRDQLAVRRKLGGTRFVSVDTVRVCDQLHVSRATRQRTYGIGVKLIDGFGIRIRLRTERKGCQNPERDNSDLLQPHNLVSAPAAPYLPTKGSSMRFAPQPYFPCRRDRKIYSRG